MCSRRELFCPNTTLGGGEHQTKVLSSHILAFYLSIQSILLLLTPITNVLYLFICRCIMGPASLHIQSEIYRQFSNTKHPPRPTSLNAFVTLCVQNSPSPPLLSPFRAGMPQVPSDQDPGDTLVEAVVWAPLEQRTPTVYMHECSHTQTYAHKNAFLTK